ncbi:hypothetical protein GCM10010389_47400 [Streptomyces echinoruber]|uniref:Uncharacterized protein n=1 Tax=Streptomyces echinoruber TaxID=68898 RepID=A0A918VK52_9ACTN|nr:hypothetical protein GCM10010389_47400 [Streptomyces echinoruber]
MVTVRPVLVPHGRRRDEGPGTLGNGAGGNSPDGDGTGGNGPGGNGPGLGRAERHGREEGRGKEADVENGPPQRARTGHGRRDDLRHALPNAPPARTLRPPPTRPPPRPKDFALRPARLVPWGAIGDTTLVCAIICTHHSRTSTRAACAGGVA